MVVERLVCRFDSHLEALRAAVDFQTREHLVHEVDHGHRLRIQHDLVRVELGKVEQIVEQGQDRQAVGPEPAQQLRPVLGREVVRRKQIRESQHGRDRRADLVAHVAKEDVLGNVGTLGDDRPLFVCFDRARRGPPQLADQHVDAVSDRVKLIVPGGDRQALTVSPAAICSSTFRNSATRSRANSTRAPVGVMTGGL